MKRNTVIAVAAFAVSCLVGWAVSVHAQSFANVTCSWVSGDLYCYDKSGNEIYHVDGTNRAFVIPAGSTLSGGTAPAPSTNSIDLGTTTTPYRNLYLYGAGTYATTYLKFTGTPTGTRTVTFPDATDTVAEIGQAQTFSAANTFSATNTFSGAMLMTGASVQGNTTVKALTESSATAFSIVTVPSASYVSGSVEYAIEATDATDYQVRGGVLPFTAVNKGGTTTCTVATVTTATEVVSVSTGTLTNTFTCVDGGSGALQLKANAVSSLTQTTLQIRYRVRALAATTLTVTAQ